MHRLTLRNSLFILCLMSLSLLADSFGNDYASSVLLAAAWVAPVIAGIGAAGSAIGSLISQADANKANREIAAENREWQSGENEKSRQWEEKMWNAQNLYNTPSAAKARLKEAGFNPYLVESSNIGNGNATSAGSPSMSGAPSTPEIKPLPFGEAFNNLGQSVAHAYNEAKSVDSNSANQTAMANKTHVEVAQQLDKMYPGRGVGQNYLQKNLRATNGENTDNSLVQRQAKAAVIEQEAAAADARLTYKLNKKYKATQIQNLISLQDKEYEKIGAEIGKMASDAKVNDAEIEKYLAEKAKLLAEKAHLSADTETVNAIRDYLVDKAEADADIRMNESIESDATFVSRSSFRKWLRSGEAKDAVKRSEIQEGNYAPRVSYCTCASAGLLHYCFIPFLSICLITVLSSLMQMWSCSALD